MIIGMVPVNIAQGQATRLESPRQCLIRMADSAAVSSNNPSPWEDEEYCLDMPTTPAVKLPMGQSGSQKPVLFIFGKLVFQYDRRAFIRLHDPLHVKITNGRLEISEWEAEVDLQLATGGRSSLNEAISAAIIRHFQTLFQGAADDTLTAGQRSQWLKVLSSFDYQAFQAGLSHPTYEEGKVWSISSQTVVIEWEGSRRDQCPIHLSPSFHNGRVQEGDRIGAMVTRGERGEVVAIDDIRVLPTLEDAVPWEKVETATGQQCHVG